MTLTSQQLDELEESLIESTSDSTLLEDLISFWEKGFSLGEDSSIEDIFVVLRNEGVITYASPNIEISRLRDLKPQGLSLLRDKVTIKLAKVARDFFEDRKKVSTDKSRLAVIARTELTQALNKGRTAIFERTPLVSHALFTSVLDSFTTEICKSREGMVVKVGTLDYKANEPALHFYCRSMYSPLIPSLVPRHAALVADPSRKPYNRVLAPLLPGWSIT